MNTRALKIAFVVVGAALGCALIAANAGHPVAVSDNIVTGSIGVRPVSFVTNPIVPADVHTPELGSSNPTD
jgi:hypothetical protein